MKKQSSWSLVMLAALILVPNSSLAEKPAKGAVSTSTGRYLAIIAGCNDCHTKGWIATEAKIPEAEWLAGDVTGWSGPWGTTYAPNLRLLFQNLSEDSWVSMAHTLQARPPMPWWALHTMKDADLRGIYRFIKKLGPAGQPAPPYQAARTTAQASLLSLCATTTMMRRVKCTSESPLWESGF